MSSYPNRCQHIKINGTQCGSPALRRNRFCFFHKRFRDEQIKLAADRKRQIKATFVLPVLEDANSIQVALMQVMRLLIAQQIEHKTASLLLYALQTASSNLRKSQFNPLRHQVILDPRDAADASFQTDLWEDEDFEDEDDDEEEEELDEIERQSDEAAEEARKQTRRRLQQQQKQKEQEAYMRNWVNTHPGWGLKRENGVLKYIHPQARKPEHVATAALGCPPRAQSRGETERSLAIATPAAPKLPDLKSRTTNQSTADVHTIVRKHSFPNMPEAILPKDGEKKPADRVKPDQKSMPAAVREP
jgi:hypothetical protein